MIVVYKLCNVVNSDRIVCACVCVCVCAYTCEFLRVPAPRHLKLLLLQTLSQGKHTLALDKLLSEQLH